MSDETGRRPRARDLGITIGTLEPGPRNAITDVDGVRVGHSTIIEDGDPAVGRLPVRTGVTVVVPHDGDPFGEAVFAGSHRLNGNGDMTGLEWIRESGRLASPVAITNTSSVGVVRDALIAEAARRATSYAWSLPVVGETWDGWLNDVDGQHVRGEHALEALDDARGGDVREGNVGGGTGMICHGFKGGIGTASRRLGTAEGGYTVGALVQANHGRRERLAIDGVPVGRAIGVDPVPSAYDDPNMAGAGSVIVVLGTDAPLLPGQCERLAQRAGLGVARVGGGGENASGDLFFAFATGNRGLSTSDDPKDMSREIELRALSDAWITPLFWAAIEATEEAIVNALVAAETMSGRDGHISHRLPHDRLLEVWQRHRG
jgi:D-aminopeptidase